MLTVVQDFLLSLLPAKKRTSQGGWISFNAVCCPHNGETIDKRGRGGVHPNPDGSVSYSCFNCGFKANYTPGRHLNYKFRKLLGWLGASTNEVQRLVIEAIRIKDLVDPEDIKVESDEEINFESRALPPEAKSFAEWDMWYKLGADQDEHAVPNYPAEFMHVVDYIWHRGGSDILNYSFYWSTAVEHKLSHRIIIPFYWKGKIVGWTARAIVDGIKPKYYSDHPTDFVFNMDRQQPDSKFVIVVEGCMDAMVIDGVSVQGFAVSERQADIIDSLGREVIVVPDFDRKLKNGKSVWSGESMVESALEYGWSVAFPIWSETCKDINDAVKKYGKLFTLKAILDSRESNPLKIKLMSHKI